MKTALIIFVGGQLLFSLIWLFCKASNGEKKNWDDKWWEERYLKKHGNRKRAKHQS